MTGRAISVQRAETENKGLCSGDYGEGDAVRGQRRRGLPGDSFDASTYVVKLHGSRDVRARAQGSAE